MHFVPASAETKNAHAPSDSAPDLVPNSTEPRSPLSGNRYGQHFAVAQLQRWIAMSLYQHPSLDFVPIVHQDVQYCEEGLQIHVYPLFGLVTLSLRILVTFFSFFTIGQAF
jgi:hypothetical protein